MKLFDFSGDEQKAIKNGLSTAKLSDKEASQKILDLVPEEWINKIPFFVRNHSTTKTIERIAHDYPDLYDIAKKPYELPEKEREELRKIVTDIFQERMAKHNIK